MESFLERACARDPKRRRSLPRGARRARFRGKAGSGTLYLRAKARPGFIAVEVEEDGRGIDWERLRQVAAGKGLPAETERNLVDALFADGVTTKQGVSEISGRGVGISAVKACVEGLAGTIEVTSRKGFGTIFRFDIPE